MMVSMRRRVAAVAVGIAVAACGIGGAYAWLNATASVNNAFVVGDAQPIVVEDFEQGGSVKRDVAVTNEADGDNVAIYVRARVDVYWEDGTSAVLPDKPEQGTDYEVSWGAPGADGEWLDAGNGTFYWNVPLEPGETTANLIDELSVIGDQDGRSLVCDVASQGIQAEPHDAVEQAWGVTVADGGTISIGGE